METYQYFFSLFGRGGADNNPALDVVGWHLLITVLTTTDDGFSTKAVENGNKFISKRLGLPALVFFFFRKMVCL